MTNFNKVSVILPTYNEIDNVVEVIERLSKALGNNLHEIIVVDDNSPDGTWKKVQELKNPKYKLIRRLTEKGLASALTTGIQEATGNSVAWLDCDLGIPPEIVPKLIEKLNDNDVVIGSRYVSGGGDPRPFPRPLLSDCMNLFARLILNPKIRDYTSGVAAARRGIMNDLLWNDDGFGEYFVEFSYRCIKEKAKITEIPLQYSIRKNGISKSDGNLFVLLKYGFQYGFKILKLKFAKKTFN